MPRLHDLYALLDFHDSDRNSTRPRHDLYRRFTDLLTAFLPPLQDFNCAEPALPMQRFYQASQAH